MGNTAKKAVPARCVNGLAKMNGDKPLAKLDPDTVAEDILTQYRAGRMMYEIAKGYGVTPAALYLHLMQHCEERWKDSQAVRALQDYDEAEEGLRRASDGLELARARELVRSQQWKLERTWARVYGDRPPPNVSNTVMISIGIDRSKQSERVIEAE